MTIQILYSLAGILAEHPEIGEKEAQAMAGKWRL
jgi:hypothetical protein